MNEILELTPSKIEHLIDTDLNVKTGDCSYHYNFLVYTFDHPLGTVTARSYLDTAKEVSILQRPAVQDLEGELASVIQYLRARYRKLMVLGEAGYSTI